MAAPYVSFASIQKNKIRGNQALLPPTITGITVKCYAPTDRSLDDEEKFTYAAKAKQWGVVDPLNGEKDGLDRLCLE